MLFDQRSQEFVGAHGTLPVGEKDEVALKFAMLISCSSMRAHGSGPRTSGYWRPWE